MKSSTTIFPKEELANAITHGLALLLSIIATPILIAVGAQNGSLVQVLGLGVFCFSMIMVYTSSTIFHSILDERLKHVFRIIDHISIYFLIAGTHTPLVLLYFHQTQGWFFLLGLWSLVLIGTLFKLFFTGRYEFFSIAIYVLMGWSGFLLLPQMFAKMDSSSINWLITGGLLYSVGIIFYVWKKIPYHHAIWHLFVIGGTSAHFVAILMCFL